MNISLPEGASTSGPASREALEFLRSVLRSNAEYLLPLYRITDGFETVVRGGELHLLFWPIEEFSSIGDTLVVIGTDTGGADVVVNMASDPAAVELWCGYGGGKIKSLCTLPGLIDWLLERPGT